MKYSLALTRAIKISRKEHQLHLSCSQTGWISVLNRLISKNFSNSIQLVFSLDTWSPDFQCFAWSDFLHLIMLVCLIFCGLWILCLGLSSCMQNNSLCSSLIPSKLGLIDQKEGPTIASLSPLLPASYELHSFESDQVIHIIQVSLYTWAGLWSRASYWELWILKIARRRGRIELKVLRCILKTNLSHQISGSSYTILS